MESKYEESAMEYLMRYGLDMNKVKREIAREEWWGKVWKGVWVVGMVAVGIGMVVLIWL